MGRIVVASAYASPIHGGHIEYLTRAKELAGPDGKLIVIINTDAQSILKKGYSFQPQEDRMAVVGALRAVDEVVLSIDTDRSVCATLAMLAENPAKKPGFFVNGGDRNNGEIPEAVICRKYGIELVDGLGDKIQSSSWLIEAAAAAEEKKKAQN